MNVNIILDSEYICNKLTEGEEKTINNLFTYFKNKSNIIILQDNNKDLNFDGILTAFAAVRFFIKKASQISISPPREIDIIKILIIIKI